MLLLVELKQMITSSNDISFLLIAIANNTSVQILSEVVSRVVYCLFLLLVIHLFLSSIDKYKVQSLYPLLFFL